MARFTVLALCVFFIDYVLSDTVNIDEQDVSLSQDIALLRQVVLTLQDTVRSQGVLITDLCQSNQQQEKRIEELEAAQKNTDEHRQQQEKRIEELEAAQKNSDEHRKQQEYWLKDLVSKFISDNMVSSENTKHTDKTIQNAIVKGKGIKREKIDRKVRLLASLIPPTNTPPVEEGIVAFYAQMSKDESNPSVHHTLIFDKVRTNVGNGYNGVTGIFTAPREGIYVFNWVIRMHNAQHSTELLINNDIFGAAFLRAKNGDDGSVSGTAVAHVGKGDVVFVRTHFTLGGDGNILSDLYSYTTFSGWLLH